MVKQYSRRNGWSLPPHPLQVIAWLLVVYFTLISCGQLVCAFPQLWIQVLLYVLLGLVMLATIVANIVVTTIDPADDNVRVSVHDAPRPQFDRSTHGRVIDEQYYCHVCEAKISSSAKHCRQCNKCVEDFDHHCKWLNNCVGRRNYRWFIAYVALTIASCTMILVVSLVLIAYHFATPDAIQRENGTLLILGEPVTDDAWVGLVIFTAVAALIVVLLNSHLFIFHIRLITKGITTYTFIMQLREQEDSKPTAPKELLKHSCARGLSLCRNKRSSDRNRPQGDTELNESILPNYLSVGWKSRGPAPSGASRMDSAPVAQRPSFVSAPLPPIPGSQFEQVPPGAANPAAEPLKRVLPPLQQASSPDTTLRSRSSSLEQATGVDGANKRTLPPLKVPPHATRSEKLYEPPVESVFLRDGHKEVYLPSITVNPPSDVEDTLTEIPLASFRRASVSSSNGGNTTIVTHSGAIVTPSMPGLYIASGQFSLVKMDSAVLAEHSRHLHNGVSAAGHISHSKSPSPVSLATVDTQVMDDFNFSTQIKRVRFASMIPSTE